MANIKEQFPEFFQNKLDIHDLESHSNNLIILDTNFLLDIIQLPTDISKKYIEALKKVEDNIYIPYLVALEFNFRKSGIKKEKHYNIGKYKDNVKGLITSLEESISSQDVINIKEIKKQFSDELLAVVTGFREQILPMLDKKIAEAITEEENTIYEELISIIENNIGEKYEQEFIDLVELDGITRYENKFPPGFDDQNKDETEESTRTYGGIVYQRKFGDLIIWKDIIRYSKSQSEKGSKVIYVTNDGQSNKKQDLLYKVKNLTVGPHIYLMNELQMEAQKELYILPNSRFVQVVANLSEEQLKEIEDTSELVHKRLLDKQKLMEIKLLEREREMLERKLSLEQEAQEKWNIDYDNLVTENELYRKKYLNTNLDNNDEYFKNRDSIISKIVNENRDSIISKIINDKQSKNNHNSMQSEKFDTSDYEMFDYKDKDHELN